MAKQLEMKGVSGWGGKRRGAGRKNRSGLVSHGKRETVNFKLPLNLTLRLKVGVPDIRRKNALKLFQVCCERAKKFGFRVIHFSLQTNHIHLIVEARDNEALARGMQSLASSFAKGYKALLVRWPGSKVKGSVFDGRYHLRTIGSPTQMKNTLRYVLLNTTKHEDSIPFMDPFSSAREFPHWRKLLGRAFTRLMDSPIRDPEAIGLSHPRSWLAREGWMRAA